MIQIFNEPVHELFSGATLFLLTVDRDYAEYPFYKRLQPFGPSLCKAQQYRASEFKFVH